MKKFQTTVSFKTSNVMCWSIQPFPWRQSVRQMFPGRVRSTVQAKSHDRVTISLPPGLQVSLQHLPFDLSCKGGPDSSYTTHGRALWVISTWTPPRHTKIKLRNLKRAKCTQFKYITVEYRHMWTQHLVWMNNAHIPKLVYKYISDSRRHLWQKPPTSKKGEQAWTAYSQWLMMIMI